MKSFVVIIVNVLLLLNISDCQQLDQVQKNIEYLVEDLFQLWTKPCSNWTTIFTENSVWYHPKFPKGIQYNQLSDFCQTNQQVRPALFRQDGHIRLTTSGNQSNTQLYHVLVPYVYGQIQNEDKNSLFINSGYEYIEITVDSKQVYRIQMIVEFFNRASLPFDWPPLN